MAEPGSAMGGADVFLTKFSNGGVLLWTRQLGTTETDIGRAIVWDRGFVYITGITGGDLHRNGSGQWNGDKDIFVAKYDDQGNLLWVSQLGSARKDGAYGITVDIFGDLYIAGYTNGDIDGSGPGQFFGGEDIFYAKINSRTATWQWFRQVGTPGQDTAYGIAFGESNINDDYLYITGSTSGNLDGHVDGHDIGGTDVFVIKAKTLYPVNPADGGTPAWTKQFWAGDGTREVAKGVAFGKFSDQDRIYTTGNVLAPGYFGNLDDVDGFGINRGANDDFLLGFDKDGVGYHPSDQLGTALNDSGNGIATDSSGNVYVTGSTAGQIADDPHQGAYDVFVVKYQPSADTYLSRAWVHQFGSTANDLGSAVATDSQGNVYVVGGTSGSLNGRPNVGYTDAFLIKYNSAGIKQ